MSYISSAPSQPFLLIDLINLRNVTVDVPTKSAWVQAGAVLGELYHSIASASGTLAFPAGICPSYGMLLRKYGMAADNVLDARLVDAEGRILDRAGMGEDVFWAIRGGGGNTYGVVVSWKVKLVPVPRRVTGFKVSKTSEGSLTKVIQRYQHFAKLKAKSDYVQRPLPVRALQGIWRSFDQVEAGPPLVQMVPHGGRMSRISNSSIPYPHRSGNIYKIQYFASWFGEDKKVEKRHLHWINGLYRFMTPYVSNNPRGAYPNSRDLDLGVNDPVGRTSYKQARVWGEQYFKHNFERLARVKAAIDPSNFFRNEQSVPPFVRMTTGRV
ncbi:unnamed protein product [Linum tenue]|uniref:FAD-binding PCMH-type domain-containing protein n=1 Tax=Linum tenue TaxID=586396 RepID=A0AAV0QNB8_9ROSI|nr:unnamed protein product [Linum tenue]CAI0545908.1 unnamed protein product [Linum tenue]